MSDNTVRCPKCGGRASSCDSSGILWRCYSGRCGSAISPEYTFSDESPEAKAAAARNSAASAANAERYR